MYSIHVISQIVSGTFLQKSTDDTITYLSCDSRNLQYAESTLFFAFITSQADGHHFIADAYKKGIRNFIVSKELVYDEFPDSNILLVSDTLEALQQLAAYHRQQFEIPVIGITGSNGKTIVKEWLYQMLEDDFTIARSPKSYNSQIGVPLSVWQLSAQHTLAIFEAGISQKGEMEKLSEIIQPTIGIITNIGEAHSSGFTSVFEKTVDKLKLVQEVETLIYSVEALRQGIPGDEMIRSFLNPDVQLLNWSFSGASAINISLVKKESSKTIIHFLHLQQTYSISIPFTDDASLQNAMHCVCVLVHFGYNEKIINERLQRLHAMDMRLQLKHGTNHCLIINDSYSADLTSLQLALQFLKQQSSGLKRTVILSDFFESGHTEEALYNAIKTHLHSYRVEKLVGIGSDISRNLKMDAETHNLLAGIECFFYPDTDAFIQHFKSSQFSNECILIKGARKFEFERIASLFDAKVHQTLLEINLNAIAHNLKQYRQLLQPQTKIMAMVKAFAYGSGGAEIAGVLQYNNIDFLGVAYADEGIELRKAGIGVPILVMNADEESFAALVSYNLQPVLYSTHFLHAFEAYLKSVGVLHYPVHLEVETGMNRLGFSVQEIKNWAQRISGSAHLKIVSVFSHLAASEDAAQDDFTAHQANLLDEAVQSLQQFVSYPFLKHIANSAAIIRHPHLQFDMVRLGIGLYGIEMETNRLQLQAAATLKSTIAQIKKLRPGETVSYNRYGKIEKESVTATVRIGYADGYSRRLGKGVGDMWINGKLAPVVGSVCMDMTMIDITEIPNVQEGDEVIVFGENLPVQQLASWMNTIPYEVMTSISQRVKRIYFQE